MLFENKPASIVQTLLPAMLICVLYSLFVGLPIRRELRHQQGVLEERADVIDRLRNRIAASVTSASPEITLAANQIELPSSDESTSVPRNRSIVESFADVMAIFQANQILCLAVDSEESDCKTASNSTLHRMTLDGSFPDMLAAINTLRTETPQAVIHELSLRQSVASATCHWQLLISISKELP